MAVKLMGKKRGQTQAFDDKGNLVVCTVIHAEPNVITQIKRKETDGYSALQLGYQKIVTKDPRTVAKRVTKQLQGHYKKAGVEPRSHLAESRIENVDEYEVGQELGISLFSEVAFVDVSGTSKGKGFQGVIKRYNFKGGPASHGSGFHRAPGSIGMCSSPGEVFKGKKMPGRMGSSKVTVQSLRVIRVDEEKNILIVEGSVPGPKGAIVSIAPAMKKRGKKS